LLRGDEDDALQTGRGEGRVVVMPMMHHRCVKARSMMHHHHNSGLHTLVELGLSQESEQNQELEWWWQSDCIRNAQHILVLYSSVNLCPNNFLLSKFCTLNPSVVSITEGKHYYLNIHVQPYWNYGYISIQLSSITDTEAISGL
jgi:hypothetical protein